MSIREICVKDVITIKPGASLAEASRLMSENHIGSLVVVENSNGGQKPTGMITDRDLALAMDSASKPQDLEVSQLMRSHPITATIEDGIYETIQKMRKEGVKRLPVVDKTGALYGIVSADDLMNLLSREMSGLSEIREVQVSNEKGVRMPAEVASGRKSLNS